MFTYDVPLKNYNGLWVTEVEDEKGRTVAILKYVTKKSLLKKIQSEYKGAKQK